MHFATLSLSESGALGRHNAGPTDGSPTTSLGLRGKLRPGEGQGHVHGHLRPPLAHSAARGGKESAEWGGPS